MQVSAEKKSGLYVIFSSFFFPFCFPVRAHENGYYFKGDSVRARCDASPLDFSPVCAAIYICNIRGGSGAVELTRPGYAGWVSLAAGTWSASCFSKPQMVPPVRDYGFFCRARRARAGGKTRAPLDHFSSQNWSVPLKTFRARARGPGPVVLSFMRYNVYGEKERPSRNVSFTLNLNFN